jgi:HEAT repeat protein
VTTVRSAARLASAAALLLLSAAPARAQAPEDPSSRTTSAPASRVVDLARLVERANHVNPYMSAQASKALETHGVAALSEVEAFVARRSIYALSAPVVTWLGALDDPRARALLLRVALDRDFPWRPYAVRALAVRPLPQDRAAFLQLLSDRLAPVREAAALGLGAAGTPAEASDALLERRSLQVALADPSFDVRAGAAEALRARGDASGTGRMVKDLALTRRFFDLDFGEIARRRAWAFVVAAAGDKILATGYDPGAPAIARDAALPAVHDALGIRADDPASRQAADAEDVIFGLEVRSCRRGDAFIRLTAGGEIVAGQYDLRRAKVAAATWEEMRKALEAVRTVPPLPLYGRPGCDFERYYLLDEEGLRKITVGPEGRPPAARRLSALILEALGAGFGSDAAAEHLERIAPYAAGGEEDGAEDG